MKTTLFLMVGYPGSGKTTVSGYIQELTGAVHIWADKERQEMFGETYQTDHSDELYEKLNKRTFDLLKSGTSVIYDTNFGLRSDREKLRDLADKAGARVTVIWLTANKSVSWARIKNKAKNSGSRVFEMTEKDFDRVADKFQVPEEDESPVCLSGQNTTLDLARRSIN